MTESILKQLARKGLISERVYSVPDGNTSHVDAEDAKIEPDLPQPLDPNASKDEKKPEESEDTDEDKPADDTVEDEVVDERAVDGARALAALQSSLQASHVLADLVYKDKDAIIGSLGDEAGPVLHEVLFKVKTAHEALEGLMDGAEPKEGPKDPEEEEAEDPKTDDKPPPAAAPNEDKVTPPVEKKPGDLN